jgi:preprotein translocase subunit YajC
LPAPEAATRQRAAFINVCGDLPTVFIATAHAQAPAPAGPPAGAELFNILFLVGLFVLFYFIAIRPQRKRQKEHAAMVAALSKGDEVVTSSGILGKISSLDDNYVVLNVHNNVD